MLSLYDQIRMNLQNVKAREESCPHSGAAQRIEKTLQTIADMVQKNLQTASAETMTGSPDPCEVDGSTTIINEKFYADGDHMLEVSIGDICKPRFFSKQIEGISIKIKDNAAGRDLDVSYHWGSESLDLQETQRAYRQLFPPVQSFN